MQRHEHKRRVRKLKGAAMQRKLRAPSNKRTVAASKFSEERFASAEIPRPNERLLKVYAFDPSKGHLIGNYMTASVRYEKLRPGPMPSSPNRESSRFAVIDYDGSNNIFYKRVDLDDPLVLICGGLDPSQSDPRFHQQMVYAVASETLQRFEFALGRIIRWRVADPGNYGNSYYGQQRVLNLFPHAMFEANAFYCPKAHGILFGYFHASQTQPGHNLPGQPVFTCLSHDIIVHETTHAVVDGIRKYFMEPTNIDVRAFHEAFADLAALFSHFAHKEALLDTLQKTGGRLFDFQLTPEARLNGEFDKPIIQAQIASANPLIELALQFGEASGMHSGLRSALGTPPNSNDLKTKTEPHARGSILVAAVFDAYFTIYTRRTAGLFRIYRAGGGAENGGYLPDALADHLAAIASRTAEQFFVICARALDYCPPVDITFGDFLRALITADLDLHPSDPDGIRDALMQAFRLRGIVPDSSKFFSEESLCWPKIVEDDQLPRITGLRFGDPNGLTTVEQNMNGDVLRKYAKAHAQRLGFDPNSGPIEAPSFHPMFHVGEDGSLWVNMVVELVQTIELSDPEHGQFPMRSGVTLLIAQDPPRFGGRPDPRIRFVIPKLYLPEREERQRNYFASNPPVGEGNARFQIDFALLHAGV